MMGRTGSNASASSTIGQGMHYIPFSIPSSAIAGGPIELWAQRPRGNLLEIDRLPCRLSLTFFVSKTIVAAKCPGQSMSLRMENVGVLEAAWAIQ